MIFIHEPINRIPRTALYLCADEEVIDGLPGLSYLVRIRIVEFQDWSNPPGSPDEGNGGRDLNDEDDDFDDSNHNHGHPDADLGNGHSRGPRTFRCVDDADAPGWVVAAAPLSCHAGW
jgi:hypothetical protein